MGWDPLRSCRAAAAPLPPPARISPKRRLRQTQVSEGLWMIRQCSRLACALRTQAWLHGQSQPTATETEARSAGWQARTRDQPELWVSLGEVRCAMPYHALEVAYHIHIYTNTLTHLLQTSPDALQSIKPLLNAGMIGHYFKCGGSGEHTQRGK
jgi:hypothetical protein